MPGILSRATYIVFPLVALLVLCQSALAASGSWSANENSRLRIVSSVDAVGEGAVSAGLHFQMAPGWKTYWRSPGDAGYPMDLDWSGSRNVASVEVDWPAPHRFSLFGMDTFGYHEEVIFPLRVEAADPAEAVHLVAEVDYLLCENVCIPYKETVSLSLPPGSAGVAPEVFLIDAFRHQVPGDESASGITVEELGLAGEGDALRLEARVSSEKPFASTPDMIVEGPSSAHFGRPEVVVSEDGTSASFVLPVSARDAIEGEDVILTVLDRGRALEVGRTLQRTDDPVTRGEAGSLLVMLGIALLGGLILNLMPCVLPVLSIKLMALVSHSESSPRQVRLSFLATSAGILFSFLLLAGGLIALKAMGSAVGWGIQFQQPIFLAFMTLVVTLFAANLFGFFEIILPGAITRRLSSTGSEGLAGSFATGAFTTLLATPCSAPFLGTAVGFALSQGSLEISMIFAALGVGLALPYLLIVAFPRLARLMPRPGRWMIWLRYVMGAALAATALWLLSVLSVQIGLPEAILLGFALVFLVALFGLRHFTKRRIPAFRTITASIGLAALAVAGLASPPEVPASQDPDGPWHECQRERIAEAVADGQTVIVDVTADWCITCQVNKARVLENEAVEDLLYTDRVLAMRADWTRPNDRIADYLSDHGRYGIPFNVVYGPGAPDGISLPELLTVDAVLEAVEQAGQM